MSTRGFVGICKDGVTKGTYNHFDSYPSGLGVDLLKELQSVFPTRLYEAKKHFDKLKLVDDQKKPTKPHIKKYGKLADTSVGSQGTENREIHTYYQLLHQLQGTLKLFLTGEVNIMIDNVNFIKDSLFCEWAYVVNLDTEKLEVYEGFQKVRQVGNRYGEVANADGYFPCKLVKEYPLSKLPNETNFIKDLVREE